MKDHGKFKSWESRLEDLIDSLAKEVLYDLTKWELEQLAARDPSFEELARRARFSLAEVEDFLERQGEEAPAGVINYKQLVEILEQIAVSIVERDTKLLTDCAIHLEEFLHIRNNRKGANHE